MANKVSQILAQAKSIAGGYLTGWQELKYVFDVSKNSLRLGHHGYGVRPLSADDAETVIGYYTLDHQFQLVLVSTWARGDDAEKFTEIDSLYDKADEVFQLYKASSLNLAATGVVMHVFDPSFEEPEIIEENKLIVLRMQFYVKYRNTVP